MKRSYRVLARLGEGGMATVYLALIGAEKGFRKLVALKVLRDQPGIALDKLREMFAHEARVSARCHHRNIVQIHDVCDLDGKPALCMEYLDGQTYRQVKTRAAKIGGLPLFDQIRILAEAAHGLHHVHTLTDYDGRPLGLVHCDVSPENVFLTYDGQVKLLDFGIAQAHGDTPRPPGFRGKLTYLAPEIIRGDRIDARADVFALGAMLWEAVSVAPFSGGPTVDDLTRVRTRLAGTEANIRGVQPAAPEALAQIIDRAIALEPGQRFPNAEAFANALEGYLHTVGAQPSAQGLSKLITPMFERDRAKLRVTVTPQLQLADRWDREHESAAAEGDHEGLDHVGAAPTQLTAEPDFSFRGGAPRPSLGQPSLGQPSLGQPPYTYADPADTVDPGPRSASRWKSVAVLALVATLGVLGGSLLGSSDTDNRVVVESAAPPSQPSPAPSAPVGATSQAPARDHAGTAAPGSAAQAEPPQQEPRLEIHDDAQAERSGLTSEACITTTQTLRDEMTKIGRQLVRSQERRARRHERRAQRRAEQCAAGMTEKC